MPSLVLGVDGGGTKTVAWLARIGDDAIPVVIGRGFGGPSNQRAVGPAMATLSLETAVAAAFSSAAIERQTIAAACFGLAGADRASDRGIVEQWARQIGLAGRLLVVNDARPLLHAGQMSGVGIALIAGTGSLALGREPGGQMARCGGWGWLIGDEGSAFSIGRAVLNRVTRAADGRDSATPLLDYVLHHFSLTRAEELIGAVYGNDTPRAVIAGLAPLAFEAARSGDAVASQVLDEAADELSKLVRSIATQLQLPSPVPLALAGAVLIQQEALRERLLTNLSSHGVKVSPVSIVTEPVEGAVRMAADIVAGRITAESSV
jgi:N-acetylglucosamine kinase-like BadF-type ATPase